MRVCARSSVRQTHPPLHGLRRGRVRVGVRDPPPRVRRRSSSRTASSAHVAEARGRLGADVVPLTYEWGQTPAADDVTRVLAESGAKLAFIVHSETWTGRLRHRARRSVQRGGHMVWMRSRASGAVPLKTDRGDRRRRDGVAGGADDAAGPRLREHLRAGLGESAEATLPRFYWDWARARTAQEKGSTPFTPATSTVVALNAAL